MNKNTFSYRFQHVVKNFTSPKIGFLFIGLIILQFYLLPLMPLLYGTDINKYITFLYIYSASTYTLIIFGIIIFHFHGIEILRDHITLWVIALSCFLPSTFGGDYHVIYNSYMSFLGIAFAIYLIVNRKNLSDIKARSFFVGLTWSVGTVVATAILRALLSPVHGTLPSDILPYIINTTVFQLTFVTIVEEVCFRGLMYGFMIMNGYRENTALLIQGILFWGIHYMKINDPILFFIVIPVFTLSATLLVKKYKMLYMTIVLHTLNNVFGGILVALF